MKAFSKKTPAEIYLEWVNDWLTVSAMAENYGRSYEWMMKIIEEGKKDYLKSIKK